MHEVEVRRRSGATDRFGQPVDANPTEGATGALVGRFKCRLDPGKGGLVNQERSRDVFEVRHMLYMEPDADVREDDTIKVTDTRTGTVLLPSAKVKVKGTSYDARGAHHLEVEAWVQRGPL
mgnify:CR=1 FL=1